jgi:hypothetical protein
MTPIFQLILNQLSNVLTQIDLIEQWRKSTSGQHSRPEDDMDDSDGLFVLLHLRHANLCSQHERSECGIRRSSSRKFVVQRFLQYLPGIVAFIALVKCKWLGHWIFGECQLKWFKQSQRSETKIRCSIPLFMKATISGKHGRSRPGVNFIYDLPQLLRQ